MWNDECQKAMEDKCNKEQQIKDIMDDPNISLDGDSVEEMSLSADDDDEQRKKMAS